MDNSEPQPHTSELLNGNASNGHLSKGHLPNGKASNRHLSPADKPTAPRIIDGWKEGSDPRIDYSGHFEFGGSLGVTAMMIGFPLLMYYMWIGATYNAGALPTPLPHESLPTFLQRMGHTVYSGAFPTAKAWAMYWTFFVFEAACYLLLPGISIKGKPLAHANNQQLTYYCSAVWSFYTTLAAAGLLHTTGLFKLDSIIDDFGPLMSVAILSGFLVSALAYASARARNATHRMSGHVLYDFFMGAELNPRLFGRLDLKMFFEVRLPWYILLLVTLGSAARQYERHGYLSGELAFLCMAHFLYANACSKGEECIVPTWDIYYEKWGFMLIFWNLAGVPLSYCHCTIYLANHDPATYRWNRAALAALFVAYLVVYWVWDTANSQKNRFKAQLNGNDVERWTFPQLPWRTVRNPKTITSETGDVIFVDGWCMCPPPPRCLRPISLSRPLQANLNPPTCRRLRPQNPLHMRPILRAELGRRHGPALPLPVVLSALLRLHDHPSRGARHSAL